MGTGVIGAVADFQRHESSRVEPHLKRCVSARANGKNNLLITFVLNGARPGSQCHSWPSKACCRGLSRNEHVRFDCRKDHVKYSVRQWELRDEWPFHLVRRLGPPDISAPHVARCADPDLNTSDNARRWRHRRSDRERVVSVGWLVRFSSSR